MASLIRSQDTLDLAAFVREWQSRQSERQSDGPAHEPDGKSTVARLTTALMALFREVALHLSSYKKFPRDIFISLDRSRSCFSLWSDGHGVASGSLDDKFQRSRKLRQATMKALSHLSSTLIDRLVPVADISNPKTKGLCDQVNNILEEIDFSNVADDSSSDSASECSTGNVLEVAEDLKTDVECLIELDQILRDPVMDPEPEAAGADVSLSLWAPHQVFADKVAHRFPGAETGLLTTLGMVNYQRYLRCQTERDSNQDQVEHYVENTTGSKFHDSGLGSSLNPASSYAETIMSYRDGNRSVRIPPLPEQAKSGEPFSCVACGRSIVITTNSQWKRHLYLDLQPYVCLDTSCQCSNSAFSNRTNWLQHLALDHGMEPNWEQIKCSLCGDETGPGKFAITTHLGRHLEEISLSALPAAPNSETNSESSEIGSDNGYEVNQADDGQELLQTAESEAESELEALYRQLPFDVRSDDNDWTHGFEMGGPFGAPSSKKAPEKVQGKPEVSVMGATMETPQTAEKQKDVEDQVRKEMKEAYEARTEEVDPEKIRLMAELAAFRAIEEKRKADEKQREMEAQIRKDAEEAFLRRMEDMEAAQEEAKREIEEARIEAEKFAREKVEAERKADEERARRHAMAMAAGDESTRLRFEAEMKAEKVRREADKRAHAEAEEDARLKFEAAAKADEEQRKVEKRRDDKYAVPPLEHQLPIPQVGLAKSSRDSQKGILEPSMNYHRVLEPPIRIENGTSTVSEERLDAYPTGRANNHPLPSSEPHDVFTLPPAYILHLSNRSGIYAETPDSNTEQGGDTAQQQPHKQYKCTYPDCWASVVGYPSQRLLDAHCEKAHQDSPGWTLTIPPIKETGFLETDLKLDEEWTEVTDPAERRRISNRVAHRAYRKKLKQRLEALEKLEGSSEDPEHASSSELGGKSGNIAESTPSLSSLYTPNFQPAPSSGTTQNAREYPPPLYSSGQFDISSLLSENHPRDVTLMGIKEHSIGAKNIPDHPNQEAPSPTAHPMTNTWRESIAGVVDDDDDDDDKPRWSHTSYRSDAVSQIQGEGSRSRSSRQRPRPRR